MSGVEAIAVLGVISSIIAIVDGTKKVYDAATNPQGLPEAFREVAGRLPIIGSILKSTKQNIEEEKVDNDSYKGAGDIVKAYEEKAKKLEELFDKVVPADGASDLKRYYKAVKAWGKGSEVENLMKGMLEDVQLLTCERGMKTATKAQQEQIIKAITEVSSVSPSVPEYEFLETGFTNSNYGSDTQNNARGKYIAQGTARQYNSGDSSMNFGIIHSSTQYISDSRPNEDEAQAYLRALFLTDPRDDRAKLISIKGLRVDGTCQWIKSHTLYDQWLRSHSQLLWLSDGPGKGKTMLSIFLAEELEETARSQNKLFLQYFCDNTEKERNTAVAVLRGLIWQLLQYHPKLCDHILPSFRTQGESLFSLEPLWRIFERMVCNPALETTYYVLDGLDECDEASLEILLEKFKALFSAKTDESLACHFNLLVVSRELPDLIPNLLSSFPRISLDSDTITEVNEDIDISIEAKVEELSRHGQYPDALRKHVAKIFRIRAQDTFLWIEIVAKELRKYKKTEVEEALEKFPSGLDKLYARILLQIDSGRRDIAAKILRWVVMAVRPLTLSELSLAIEPTVNPSKVANRDERIIDQILYCGDILVIKDYRDYRGYVEDEEDEEGEIGWVRVGLIHQSAKDFLLRKNQDSNPVLEAFRVRDQVANLEIARRCLEYLQSGALENNKSDVLRDEEHLSRFPLLSYAVLHWPEHARFLDCSEDIFDLSLPFYRNTSQIRTSWLTALWYSKMVLNWEYREPPKSFTLLHLASFLGILPLIQSLVLKEGWINKIKRMLFLNKTDSYMMTALMWAAFNEHDAVVRLLLEKGADTEIKDRDQLTALIIVVRQSHKAIVRLLLKKGANFNAKNKMGRTVLMDAAGPGNAAITQLLLEQGVDVKTQDEFGQTALMVAAIYAREDIVQLLLEKGADVNAKNEHGDTAFTRIADGPSENWEATFRLLLEKGADVNNKNRDGETALMDAAGGRMEALGGNPETSEAMIRLLLENGADVNAKCRKGETALTQAAISTSKKSEVVIRLLLENGADINAKNQDGETALMKAASLWAFQLEATVRLLAEEGADVNAQSRHGETALMKAAGVNLWERSGLEEQDAMVRLLVEKGADINAKNQDGETALAVAVRQRKEAEDGTLMKSMAYYRDEKLQKEIAEERKPRLDSIIQILTLHPQT